jgi:hypothetical protein
MVGLPTFSLPLHIGSWCIESPKVKLMEHSGFMWAMLAFSIFASFADFLLIRANEVMRRRLFHLMQVAYGVCICASWAGFQRLYSPDYDGISSHLIRQVLENQNSALIRENEELRALDEMMVISRAHPTPLGRNRGRTTR